MRFIDKSIVRSTEYKTWEEQFESENAPHDKYYSNHRYYRDIAMALFYCQNGLCAYTEMDLGLNEEDFAADMWSNGRYINQSIDFFGQLDHFDESLKSKKQDAVGIKDWLWDNFFMVHTDINTKVKGKKAVFPILKPDRVGYNPFELLSYNLDLHRFTPNFENVDDVEQQEQINAMIEVLGLNYDPILKSRSKYFAEIMKDINDFGKDWDSVPQKFPTAFEMIKQELQNQ